MLEGLVSNLLNRVLGIYLQNFDPKQLSIGIWNGDVKLRNLQLRKEALDQLHLPLNVVEGHIGALTLSIPWSNLRGKPVKVNIENVFILASPREDAEYDPAEEGKRAHDVKMEKLESAELLKERNTEGMSKEEQQKQQSFTATLTTAIIDNLQVTVRNIHVRYEDSISDPGHPFAAGLTLREFSAISTDQAWAPTFIQSSSGSTHKLAKLGALAVYWDTDTSLMGSGRASDDTIKTNDILQKFNDMIIKEGDEPTQHRQFILKPVSGLAGIEMDKTGKVDVPKLKVRLFFDELGFVLDEDQYRDGLMLVDLFHYFVRHQEYRRLQPKSQPKEDPRAWFKFAGHAILDQIHDRNRRWSWAYFRERRDDRRRYIELFKKRKKEEKLAAPESEELSSLERKSTYEDLRFWRSLARNQLRKENVGVKKPPPKQTWSSWVWGGGQQQQQDDTQMSEEQRNELYNAIDWDEKKAITESVDLPKDSVKMELRVCLQTGSFALRRDPHGKAPEILSLLFDSFNVGFLQRPDSFLAKMSLQGIRLYDGTTEHSLFPQIVTVKDGLVPSEDKHVTDISDDKDVQKALEINESTQTKHYEHAFFSLTFEQHPLDGRADTAVDMRLQAMEIVYNPRFAVDIAKFFKPPERHMESIGALMDSANEAVEGIRKQTRAGLEFALEEHRSIDLHLDLQAPLIIVPDSVIRESSICLILDAGHISASSELVDKDTIRDIQSKQSQQYTEKDYQHLENLMYDKFNLRLDSTQLLIGPSIKATRDQLEAKDDSKNLHIIDRIDMDFLVETCIIPKGTELTKFRITGKLPVLHASISDAKYKNLMKLLDVAVPKFDDAESMKPKPKADTRGLSQAKPEAREQDGLQAVTRPRSKSFQFSAQRQELLLEEEDEVDRGQVFKDAEPAPEKSTPPMHQRSFEFQFVVEKLQGSLFRSDPEGKKPDQLLAELVAEKFRLKFYQRPFDMVAEVTLKTLALEDHVKHSHVPEFKNIVSSEDGNAGADSDLFNLKFVKVDKKSPEFMSVYEGISTNLDVSVSTINLIVTRRTLLTLLDFVLITFTNQDATAVESSSSPPTSEASSEVPQIEEPDSSSDEDKIRIKAELKRIAVILNDDGIRIATLALNTAHVGVMLMGRTMRVGAKIGDMSLIDDVDQTASSDSSSRQLVTIQGQELVDFTYETYDAKNEAYPGHDASIHLRSGSIKVNFVTEPFRKIVDFAVKFGKMQAIFNAARQAAANQAGQIQESASKMHFDILIRTPIVVFPRLVADDTSVKRDLLTAYLGEIYAKNSFKPLEDTKGSDTANYMSTGIRNIRLTSLLHYSEDRSEELEVINKVDLGFNITQVEHKPGYKRPDLEVVGTLSDINLRVTPPQLKLMMGLSQSIPQAFATEDESKLEQEAERDLPALTTDSAKVVSKSSDDSKKAGKSGATQTTESASTESESWTKLDLVFNAGAVGLELIQATDESPVGDLSNSSLSKFSLNDTNVKLRMMSDGALESELLIQSFTIEDSRKQEANRFRKIMSLINTDVSQQFMANVTMSGGDEKNLLVILTVDSPRVILALDYLMAIQAFVNRGLASDNTSEVSKILDEEDATQDDDNVSSRSITGAEDKGADGSEASPNGAGISISFRVNLVDTQVVLLANPAITSSEAIVLSMKQAIVAQQHAMTLQVEKVGMFLCRMDKFDSSRLRILDDFSIATSVDQRSQSQDSSLTNIQVDIEPLVLRLSVRDILLAMQIATKATSMSSGEDSSQKKKADEERQKLKETSKASTKAKRTSMTAQKTVRSKSTHQTHAVAQHKSTGSGSAILKREEMNLHIGGIRVVVIGDLHDLPILDWSVKPFGIDIRDWSGPMTAETSVDTFFNIYNFSKSAWEPLIEPWTLGFHMAKEQDPEKLTLDVFSRKSLEITLTSATIALTSKMAAFLSSNEDVLSKPRGSDAPYRIRNYTGFTLNIWAQTDNGEEGSAAKMTDGQEIPWRFEDPGKTRETLSPEGMSGVVGILLEDSGFESVNRIPVTREGETVYSLQPRKDRILHRFLVEVKLGINNVKYITFRSPLIVENNTQIPIELGVFSPDEGLLVKIEKIAPGEYMPAPVGAAFMHSLVVRPDQGFGYSWSNEKLFWKDLLRRPTSTITCVGEQPENAPPFYFQMNAVYDKNDPLPRTYPYMRIRLSAPVELQNLLPFDFKYRIYDENTKRDWTNFLRKGGISPGHVVNLSHMLLLGIELQDTPFKQSEFAIINSPDRKFAREQSLTVKDSRDLPLRLKLHYFNVPDSGGAFKVTIFSPYILLNRTGLELDVRSKAFMGQAKAAAGQGVFADNSHNNTEKAKPLMFSFPTDNQKNRALIRVGESSWSQPQSFDAIGSEYNVLVPAAQGKSEMHIGISITRGEGKYNLTNVVNLAPRFVIKSRLGEDIDIREPGSSEVTTLKSGSLHPLRFLRQSSAQQLSLCFPGLNNQWSAPFHISNVGRVHVKLAKPKQPQQLIKIEILMEEATLFVHLSFTKHWPYAIRNESDTEFIFFQPNPNLDEDDEDRGNSAGFRPIRYRLPSRSIMPYAWDYPASLNKNLILDVGGAQRKVKLAEIGPQLPFKLPPSQGTQKAFDINVVADGPKQALVLSNYVQQLSLYRQKTNASVSTNVGFEVKEQNVETTFKAELRLAGVSLSLINQKMKELLYLTFRDIEIKYDESPLYQTLDWTTKWIQIDNQLYGGIFPILLYPSVVQKTGRDLEKHPVFRAAVTRVKDDSYGVLYIKYFTVLLQQMTLEVDEDFIFALIEFSKIPGAFWSPEQNAEGKLCDEELDVPEPQKEEEGQDVYFELLHLQPIQIDLSFVRTEVINAEDTMAFNNPFMFAVNVMTMSLGNVNDAPLRYNALLLENARTSPSVLLTNIQSHFVQESLRQVHIVLGSADFLGNPVGLFNNVSSGVADIFYEPYQGLVMTDRPQDLGLGIAKGASSFVKKSVFGFSDSMAKFTGSISKGLAAASLDKEFQDQRRMSKSRNRPKHALYGITSGGNAFANSMASGIGGLARHPLEGAEKEGAMGFVKGVGKGFLGLATKPAIGAFDLASNLAEGVRNTTTVFDAEGLDRVRLTRFIPADGIVRPYSQREALGQFWLKTAENGKYFNESYIAHLELPGKELLLMLTYERIMMIRTRKLTVEWDVPLKDVAKIAKERTGLGIGLKEGRQGPFVPVGVQGARDWIYGQVRVAVQAWNEKWMAKG